MDRRVALRTDPEDFLAGMVGDEVPRQVAGTDDGDVGIVGDTELANWRCTESAGRGAFVIRMTVPPRWR